MKKLPGISAIRSVFSKLAYSPKDAVWVQEMIAVGGTEYLVPRALEMLGSFRASKNANDLRMAIQLLALVEFQNESKALPPSNGSRKENTKRNNSGT